VQLEGTFAPFEDVAEMGIVEERERSGRVSFTAHRVVALLRQ
jgi:hypothetical protein